MIGRLGKKSGFTLIELLIYEGILAIFLIVLTDILVTSLNVQLESQAASAVDRDGPYLLDRLAYDVRRSQAIIQPNTDGTSQNVLELMIGGNTYTYSTASGNLTLAIASQSAVPLNSYDTQISQVNFLRLGNSGGNLDTIQINLTLTSPTSLSSESEVRSFTTTVGRQPNQ